MKAASKTRVSPLHDLAIWIPIVDLLGLSASHLICQNQAKQVVNCATVRSSSGEIKFLPLEAQKSSACIGQTYHIIRLVTLWMKSMEWNSYEQVTCSRLPEREWRVASLCRCRCLRSEESHPWSTGWFSFVSCVAVLQTWMLQFHCALHPISCSKQCTGSMKPERDFLLRSSTL